jgi:hypothetical protein
MTAGATTALFLALVLGVMTPNLARAQLADSPVAGTWSQDTRSCARYPEEDEYRVTIAGSEWREYRIQCRLDRTQGQGPDTYAAFLSCADLRRSQTRIVRILVRDRFSAVFSELFANGRPSRNMVRCSQRAPEPSPEDLAALESDESLNSQNPEVLKTNWAKESKECASEKEDAAEACTRRRYVAKRLRNAGYCHVTHRNKEGWDPCG